MGAPGGNVGGQRALATASLAGPTPRAGSSSRAARTTKYCQPCDATTLVKFRQLLGEEGVEELLAQTIDVAVELKLIKPQELSRVIVDSTVQHKAIAHPTDSRLLEIAGPSW